MNSIVLMQGTVRNQVIMLIIKMLDYKRFLECWSYMVTLISSLYF